ncbi:MAG: FHA domain-containing protein, partial [Anaerolineales bacterium]
MPRILLKFHDKVLKKLEMTKPMLSIGRKADNDVVIDNLSVSGHHAQIVEEDGAYFILDKDSTNGTYLNDKKIVRLQLQNGDEVRIGKHTVVFQDQGASKAAPMQPAAESAKSEPMAKGKPAPDAEGQVSLDFDKIVHQEDEGKATVATMTATKEAPKLTLKEAPQEAPEKETMEAPKPTSKLAFKESSTEVLKEVPKEVPREAPEEMTLESPKESPKAPLKETPKKAPAPAIQEDALVDEEELLPALQEVTRTKKESSASTSKVATLTTISGPTDK